MKTFLYLLFCVIADGVVAWGDFLSKKWVQGMGWIYFIFAYMLYMVAIAAWFALLKLNGDLGRSTLIWSVGGIAVSMLIGFFCFNETLTILNKVGVALALAGVVLTAVR